MRSAPWHVKGINPQARETARESARRSGMSVGQWLNAVILDQADRVDDEDDEALYDDIAGDRGENLASINARLDSLGRQIERLAGHGVGGPTADEDTAERIADAIARLNGRLDHVLAERLSAASTPEPRTNSVDQALAKLGRERVRAAASYSGGDPVDISVEQAMAEIAARQHALDAELAAPAVAAQQQAAAALQCRVDEAVASLRKDLVEIGRAVSEAMPRGAVEALEGEVRALGNRIDAGRASGAEGPALAGLEQGLREVREALRGLAPADSLAGVDEAVRMLSSKLDMVAAGRQDPDVLRHVDDAIAALRNDVSQIASRDALAALTQEVRGLSDKIERSAPPASGAEIFTAIDRRIGSIADAIESVRFQSERIKSTDLDQLVRSLGDKLERIQSVPNDALARGEQLALSGLEDRITKLVEKLDVSEGRLGHLEAIERGMAELLVHLETLRANPAAAATPQAAGLAVPVEALNQDIAALRRAQSAGEERTQETLEAVHDTIETVVDRLARIETSMRRDRRDDAALPPGPVPADVPPSSGNALSVNSAAPAVSAQPLPPGPEPLPTTTAAFAPEPAFAAEPAFEPVPEPAFEPAPESMREPEPALARDAEPEPEWTPMADPAPMGTPAPAADDDAPLLSSRHAVSPAPRAATRAKPAVARPPIDPSLPPDHPLEPGSGPPRARPNGAGSTAAGRVAVSEGPVRAVRGAKIAAIGAADPTAEVDPKSDYLQAARRAAQYAAQGEKRGEPPTIAHSQTVGGKLSQRIKGLFVGLSVAVLIIAAVRYAVDYFEAADLALPTASMLAERTAPTVTASQREIARDDAPGMIVPPTGPSFGRKTGPKILSVDAGLLPDPAADSAPFMAAPAAPTPKMVGADQNLLSPTLSLALPPASSSPAPSSPALSSAAPSSSVPSSSAAPSSAPLSSASSSSVPSPSAASAETRSEVTGALPPRSVARPAPAAGVGNAEQLPAAIGGKMLITAAVAGEPAAAYEVATRFAEGRGVPQSFGEAAIWYERAAKSGLAPALFRLGALYEKGSGVTRDLNEARRLYLAAAQKGNANAMHNIGVLYAEGIDGKPDFKSAAQWFRKSSTYGIADSQYNLAVLYARGIGVERNLNEAFQWFALAAKGGDAEAARKRDEIAAGFDQRTLAALRHAVDTWVADQAPEDAATVAAPAGGWDQAEPAKPKSRPRAQSRPGAQPS